MKANEVRRQLSGVEVGTAQDRVTAMLVELFERLEALEHVFTTHTHPTNRYARQTGKPE